MKIILFIFISVIILSGFAFAAKISIEPKTIYQGEELTLNIEKSNAGIYAFLPIYYNKDLTVADVIELDCEGSRCIDEIAHTYIVDLEPASYFLGIYDFTNDDWQEIDFLVEEGFNSYVTDDISEVNNRPRIQGIPDLIIGLTDSNLENILDFNNYANDADEDELVFSFVVGGASEIIDCSITFSFLSCNKPKKIGEVKAIVRVSDGDKESQTSFNMIVVEGNNAPVAVAGEDKDVVRNEKFILDASNSYDQEGDIPSTLYVNDEPVYSWFLDDSLLGIGKRFTYSFSEVGRYKIVLKVRDSNMLVGEDSLIVNVKEKEKCKNTNAIYYPKDTDCQSQWLSKEGKLIRVNTKGYSCDLIEVCSDQLDYIIEEAIDCCDGNFAEKNSDKFMACNFANKYSDEKSKRCIGLYLIQSLGSKAIYMQDYFEAEMCCYGVEELCINEANFFTAEPFPNSDIKFGYLNCQTGDSVLGKQKGVRGWWNSDSDMEQNNIALSDLPAHTSINYLSTGTCADYAFALAALIRKAGYEEENSFAIESEDHAFNLIKLEGDEKFTVVDTTANNYAMVVGGLPFGYDYCGKIDNCYNDLGSRKCPRYNEIFGCEDYELGFNMEKIIIVLIFVVAVVLVLLVYFSRRKTE